MGRFLLLPEDELALVEHLLGDESLIRLAHEDLAHGPQVAGPLTAPLALPDATRPGAEAERFVFWAPAVGELLGDARSFVDHERSPIVVWHRAHWHASGALCAGRLSSQTRRRAEQPEALPALYDRVQLWMKRSGVKLRGPKGQSVIRAFPHAARWVDEGGPVWA